LTVFKSGRHNIYPLKTSKYSFNAVTAVYSPWVYGLHVHKLWKLVKLSAEAYCLYHAFCLKFADKYAWETEPWLCWLWRFGAIALTHFLVLAGVLAPSAAMRVTLAG